MIIEAVISIEEKKIAAMIKTVLSPFSIGDGSLDLQQFLGLKKLSELKMYIDRGNPNVLDFQLENSGDEQLTLINIRTWIDERSPLNPKHQGISIAFVHKFLDGDRGFRLWYQPDDMENAPDNFSLNEIQILPRKGEPSYPKKYHTAEDQPIQADVTVFPGAKNMISIENINPDMTHKDLPKDFPYSLKYRPDKPDDVTLIAHGDGRYCQWPFNLTLPARIGFSKEKFKKVLKQIKKI